MFLCYWYIHSVYAFSFTLLVPRIEYVFIQPLLSEYWIVPTRVKSKNPIIDWTYLRLTNSFEILFTDSHVPVLCAFIIHTGTCMYFKNLQFTNFQFTNLKFTNSRTWTVSREGNWMFRILGPGAVVPLQILYVDDENHVVLQYFEINK